MAAPSYVKQITTQLRQAKKKIQSINTMNQARNQPQTRRPTPKRATRNSDASESRTVNVKTTAIHHYESYSEVLTGRLWDTSTTASSEEQSSQSAPASYWSPQEKHHYDPPREQERTFAGNSDTTTDCMPELQDSSSSDEDNEPHQTFFFISKDKQRHPAFFSLHIGFIRHSQPAGEGLPCFSFKTDFFVAYGAERAVYCTPDLLCFLKL